MTFTNLTNHDVVGEGAYQSYQHFKDRMEELEQVLKARDALATLEYVDESLASRSELSPKELIGEIVQYSRSRPGRRLNNHAINEATIVLLSAYLEGFIEELHEEAMHQLLDERIKSSGVLVLLEYAQKQFRNPAPEKIVDLFNTCGISNMFSSLKIVNRGKITEFIIIRNRIAHGEHLRVAGQEVEKWVESILKFAKELSFVVEREIIAMKLEK